MKDQILKLAGVKSEAAFYKKFPSEEAFMKVHGKALKKAAMGASMVKDQLTQLTDWTNPPQAQVGIKQPAYQSGTIGFDTAGQFYNNYAPSNQARGQSINIAGLSSMVGNRYPSGVPKTEPFSNFKFKDYDHSKLGVGYTTDTANVDYGKTAKGLGSAAGYIQPAMDIISGIGMIKGQKAAVKQARIDADVTGVQAQAAATRDKPSKRQYARPEDVIFQPEQMSPSYGIGTNVLGRNGLELQDGGPVGGNPTEIQNTYAPNDIYADLGYEPLDDPNQVKQYQLGGDIGQGGFGDFMSQGGSDMLSNLTNYTTHAQRGPSAGNQIGKGIGGGIGTAIGGPLGGFVGGALGSVVGGLFDNSGKKIDAANKISDRNMGDIVGQQFGRGLQQHYGSYMEDGGYVSNDWTPQVIAKFGDYDVEDLLQPPHDADMLRAGGNLRSYTPPSERAMQTYAMGGELQVHRGEAEPISTNPYLPDGGETVMFRGPSHANGGMPITYGQSPVEVEGGEPAVKLQDGGTGEDNLVVFGNLQIPNQYLSEIGDPKAKGKKFKNYINDLSKIEARQNKIIEKSTNGVLDLDPKNSFDKMKLDSLHANIMGANMKLKDIAEKKQNAAAVQSAINDTAEEHGLVADDLAKGKGKIDKKALTEYAEYGKSISEAQKGKEVKASKVIKFNNGTTKYEFPNGRVMYVDKDGNKKMANISDEEGDVSNIIENKDGSVTYVRGNDAKYTYFDNGRVAIKDPDGRRYMATVGNDGEFEFDEGDLYDPETKSTTSPSAIANEKAKARARAIAATQSGSNSNQPSESRGSTSSNKVASSPQTKTQPVIDKNKQTSSNNNVYKTAANQPGFVDYNALGTTDNPMFANDQTYTSQWMPKMTTALDNPEIANQVLAGLEGYTGQDATDVKAILSNIPTKSAKLAKIYELASDKKPGPFHNILNTLIDKSKPVTTTDTTTVAPSTTTVETTKGKFPWMQAANALIPYIRPTDQMPLDPNQLTGEYFALGSNQEEPVSAQGYRPQLITPINLSLQAGRNANQADFRSLQRLVGDNPAALAALSAKQYDANAQSFGQEAGINQAAQIQAANQNVGTMNDAQLKNLGIFDTQYQRQAQAKSNTKAVTQAALNSISSKIAQNKLENRTLGTYENLYNYRYDNQGRAINMNPLATFNTQLQSLSADELDQMAAKKRSEAKSSETKAKTSKALNGTIVRALKNL